MIHQASGLTHELDGNASHGVHKGNCEPVAGHGAQACSDGASCGGLVDLVVDADRAGAAAVVLRPIGRDLHKEDNAVNAASFVPPVVKC